jgi:hypothetical protein
MSNKHGSERLERVCLLLYRTMRGTLGKRRRWGEVIVCALYVFEYQYSHEEEGVNSMVCVTDVSIVCRLFHISAWKDSCLLHDTE